MFLSWAEFISLKMGKKETVHFNPLYKSNMMSICLSVCVLLSDLDNRLTSIVLLYNEASQRSTEDFIFILG